MNLISLVLPLSTVTLLKPPVEVQVRQVRNGMWLRVVLIARILLVDKEIMSY
jgi:hypothetical protein